MSEISNNEAHLFTPAESGHAIAIVEALQAEGHQAYLAGGCVRDGLLKRVAKDFDVVTSAEPNDVLELFPRSRRVGAHFSIVLVPTDPGQPGLEVATFRGEDEKSSSAAEDALRRDFTVNALFWDPVSQVLLDEVGGQADVEARIIRCCGLAEERFKADPIRLLRAIRFACVLEFEIESSTWKAICSSVDLIESVSKERIAGELSKMWLCPFRLKAFDLLVDSGLMSRILPEILKLRGCEQPPQFHPEGDVFVHTRRVLDNLPVEAGLELVWSALLHDIAKPATAEFDEKAGRIRFIGHENLGAEMSRDILQRLKYSNDTIARVSSMVSQHMLFHQVKRMKRSKLRRLMGQPYFEELLALHRADSLGGKGDLSRYEFMLNKAKEFANEPLIPKALLTGRDLLELGVAPGVQIGKTLRQVQDLQLEGELKSREEATDWVKAELLKPS